MLQHLQHSVRKSSVVEGSVEFLISKILAQVPTQGLYFRSYLACAQIPKLDALKKIAIILF